MGARPVTTFTLGGTIAMAPGMSGVGGRGKDSLGAPWVVGERRV
ncbi:MAG: hypothetical protein V3S59_03630 [Alphaproteobacteria bacterium]